MTLNLKATVRGGRLILDEPINLPDGSEVELTLVESGDDLDDEDRARLHEALHAAAAETAAGLAIDADEVLRALRDPRRA